MVRRYAATALFVALLSLSAIGSPDTREAFTGTPVPVNVADVAPVVATVADRPQEDDPGFNSCTMGDFKPCDTTALLPYGRTFRAEVTPEPLDPSRLGCATSPGWYAVTVRVVVVEPNGVTEVVRLETDGCAWRSDVWGSVGLDLAELYRMAAKTLDA